MSESPPAQPRISDAALQLIVSCEVTDAATYRRLYQRPTRPGGASGVTIGIGYDLGQTTADQARKDWSAWLSPATMTRLAQCCGVRGDKAQPMAAALADVSVPLEAAVAIFRSTSIPTTIKEVVAAIPAAAALPPDCLGALVSLAYNRGPSFHVVDDRHREMRAIAAAIADGQIGQVPNQIRAMKRLWVENPDDPPDQWRPMHNLAGLLTRREAEAALFEAGIKAAALA